ncbi:MAG: site-specific integrase [Rubrivirga sp.]
MASLVHQKGLYYAQFYDSSRQPKRKQVPLKTKRRRVADRAFRKLEDEYALGTFDPWASVLEAEQIETLGPALDGFLAARRDLRPHTLAKYRTVIGLLVRELGSDFPLSSVGSDHIESFLKGRDRKAVTRKTYSTTLSPFFNWLVGIGFIATNPVAGVRLQRVPAKAPRYLSKEEVLRLVLAVKWDAAINPRVPSDSSLWIVPIIEANVYLGLRVSEVCNLQWEDVDLERATLTVRNRDGFTTKSGKERTLPLPDRPLEVLERVYKQSRNAQRYVFRVSPASRQLTRHYLSRRFKRYARLAGLSEDVCFHTTRHTCASWLAERGCAVEAIRLYLGHSSVRVTERYMHLSPSAFASQIQTAFGSLASDQQKACT